MKKLYLAAACILMAQPVLAGAREDARAAEQRCSAFQDDRTWLECSYGALQVMRAQLGLQPAPEYQQRLVPPAPQAYAPAPPAAAPIASVAPAPVTSTATTGTRTTVASVPPTHPRGSFMQILAGTAPPVAISTLASVRYDSQGAFIVTLENGQVWRQTDAGSTPKPRFRVGEKITITSGALWSYNLKTEGDAHSYKVGRTS